MNITRRGFTGVLFGGFVAGLFGRRVKADCCADVKTCADSIARPCPTGKHIPPPVPITLWGDGIHDDAIALEAWFNQTRPVRWADGTPVGLKIEGKKFLYRGMIDVTRTTGPMVEMRFFELSYLPNRWSK